MKELKFGMIPFFSMSKV